MGAHVVIEQLLVEALGLGAGVEEQTVLGGACGAEIIGGAAHGNNQAVIAQGALGHQHVACIILHGCQGDLLGSTIQAAHAPQLEFEMVPLGLGHVVQFVFR